jgi:hypothetical protein
MHRGSRGPKNERGRRTTAQLTDAAQLRASPRRACMHLSPLAAGRDTTHALTKACFARHRTTRLFYGVAGTSVSLARLGGLPPAARLYARKAPSATASASRGRSRNLGAPCATRALTRHATNPAPPVHRRRNAQYAGVPCQLEHLVLRAPSAGCCTSQRCKGRQRRRSQPIQAALGHKHKALSLKQQRWNDAPAESRV